MSARLGLVLGLLLSGAVAAWWLAATRAAIEVSGDPALLATPALLVPGVARSMAVSVVAIRAAALDGYAAGVRAAMPVVTTAWPLVAVAWLASPDNLSRTLAMEGLLAGYAVVLPLVGHATARVLRERERAATVATAVGVVLACGAWLLSSAWHAGSGG
jgi:hypothetical protein